MDTQLLPDNVLTTQLKKVVNWARRSSLWPLPFATACCGIEVMAVGCARYDLARFGAEAMRFSPRQSDLMIVAGRVTTKMMPVLQHIYQQMTEPKWVISMGACASTGGVFDAYATIQGIDQFMPGRRVHPRLPAAAGDDHRGDHGHPADHRPGRAAQGPRRALQLAVEPSYKPTPQPAGVPITLGGRPLSVNRGTLSGGAL
jgi:NADH-quinone oxidoreductase subunit B